MLEDGGEYEDIEPQTDTSKRYLDIHGAKLRAYSNSHSLQDEQEEFNYSSNEEKSSDDERSSGESGLESEEEVSLYYVIYCQSNSHFVCQL